MSDRGRRNRPNPPKDDQADRWVTEDALIDRTHQKVTWSADEWLRTVHIGAAPNAWTPTVASSL